MVIVVGFAASASREGRGDERRDQEESAEVAPLEDVEGVAGGAEGPVGRRGEGEFVDALEGGDDGEDS